MMSRRRKIDKTNVCKLVYAELDRLPKRYVIVMDLRRSKGLANVNIGKTKFELIVKIFDSDVDDWTHAPFIASFDFEDSDGIIWWPDRFNSLVKKVDELCENP